MEITQTNIPENHTTPGDYISAEGNKLTLENQHERLSSAEVANLWANYLSSSMKERVISYYLAKVEDQEIRELLQYFLHLAQIHLQKLIEIYRQEGHAVPKAFTESDVNTDAPRLFSDAFILHHMAHQAEIKANGYTTALLMSARPDIVRFFTECLYSAAEMYNRTTRLMLNRGLYLRDPYITMPQKTDFVKKPGYLTGFLGTRRPLTSIEISHLHLGLKWNQVRKTLFSGFSQVTKSHDIKKHMQRGREISKKHIEVFSSILIKNGLPVTMAWDSGLMDSRVAPFSDKLMVQAIERSSNAITIAEYGKALSVSLRHDIAAVFARLMAEAAKFTEDGINLMINKGFMEEPPSVGAGKDMRH